MEKSGAALKMKRDKRNTSSYSRLLAGLAQVKHLKRIQPRARGRGDERSPVSPFFDLVCPETMNLIVSFVKWEVSGLIPLLWGTFVTNTRPKALWRFFQLSPHGHPSDNSQFTSSQLVSVCRTDS